MVVKRTINGSDYRYIERLNERDFLDVKDAFCVDCGGTYTGTEASIEGATQADPVVITSTAHPFSDGDEVFIESVAGMTEINNQLFTVANSAANTFELESIDGTGFTAYTGGGTIRLATTTISNLFHIEGKEVTVLRDGNVETGLVVSDGTITMSIAGSKVHVGLHYNCDIETLDIDFQGGQTLQTRKKAVVSLGISVEDTRGLEVGHSFDDLYEFKERGIEGARRRVPHRFSRCLPGRSADQANDVVAGRLE